METKKACYAHFSFYSDYMLSLHVGEVVYGYSYYKHWHNISIHVYAYGCHGSEPSLSFCPKNIHFSESYLGDNCQTYYQAAGVRCTMSSATHKGKLHNV